MPSTQHWQKHFTVLRSESSFSPLSQNKGKKQRFPALALTVEFNFYMLGGGSMSFFYFFLFYVNLQCLVRKKLISSF